MASSSCSSSRTFATKFSSIKVIFLLILVALFGSAMVIKSVEAATAEDTRLQTQTPLALPPAKPSFRRQQAYPFGCNRPGPCPPLGKGISVEIGPFSWSYPLVLPKPNSIIPYGGGFKFPPQPKENVNPTNRKISTTEDNRMPATNACQKVLVTKLGGEIGLLLLICRPDGVCSYYVPYMDRSFSRGTIATETLTFEGIVGLGTDDVSLIAQRRYPSFSYCTTKDPNTGVVEGWIHFGSASKLFGPSTPLLANPTNDHYYLSIEGISVGGQELTLPKIVFDKGFIIDSGAAFTNLQTDAFDKLIDAVKKLMPDDEVWTRDKFELCYDNPYRVPEIELKFEDMMSFPLREGNAWVEIPPLYCLAILRTEGLSVLGMYQQSGLNVGYDLENKQLRLKNVNSCPDDDDDDI